MNTIDKEAFIKAYDELGDAIFRHCFFRVSDRELAKDLTQEVFFRTWDYIASGKSINNLRAFLYRIAHNLIVNEYRKKKMISLDLLKENGIQFPSGDYEKLKKSLEAKNLISFFAQLDSKYSEILIMRYIDDLDIHTISEITGETANAISVKLHRAIIKLQNILL